MVGRRSVTWRFLRKLAGLERKRSGRPPDKKRKRGKMDIRKLTEMMMGKMRSIMESGEEPVPVIFCIKKDEKLEIHGVAPDLMRREQLANVVKDQVQRKSVQYVVLLAVAWVATVDSKKEVDLRTGVKGVPGRGEAIIGWVYGKNNDSQVVKWKYKKVGRAYTFKDMEWTDGKQASGRFAPENIVGEKK